MLLLGEQKYCHSCIQPEYVTLVQVQDNRYLAKVIDFSELSRDDEVVQKTFTSNFFLNPLREYDSKNRIIFKNLEE
jgi:hypothetical protein